jgi:hypothetical protein
MRPEDLVQELNRRPFEPFRLFLSDGSSYEVRHPELVIVFPGKAIIATPGKGQPQPAEKYDVVSMGHIMRLSPLNSATKSAS